MYFNEFFLCWKMVFADKKSIVIRNDAIVITVAWSIKLK